MPNWCYNSIELLSTTKELNDKLLEHSELSDKPGLFQHLVVTDREKYYSDKPIPHLQDRQENGKYFDWYNHNIHEYGTKWDVHEYYYNDDILSFDTAWGPCVQFVQKLSEQYGIEVRIEFSEVGWDFAGYVVYNNGELVDEEQSRYYEYFAKHDPQTVIGELYNDEEFLEIEDEDEKLKYIAEHYSDIYAEDLLDLYKKYDERSNYK